MKLEGQRTGTLQTCELCGRKSNPHANIYKTHTLLCSTCYMQVEILPDLVADNLTRFLIGNVV